jgi:hypothetical protein
MASKLKDRRTLPIVGWREWLALPGLGVERVKAKIDTGARTSAIHAYHIRAVERDGAEWVEFELHPRQRDSKTVVHAAAPLLERRYVRNSGGGKTLRPVIVTPVRIGEGAGGPAAEWPIELTLVARDQMGCAAT